MSPRRDNCSCKLQINVYQEEFSHIVVFYSNFGETVKYVILNTHRTIIKPSHLPIISPCSYTIVPKSLNIWLTSKISDWNRKTNSVNVATYILLITLLMLWQTIPSKNILWLVKVTRPHLSWQRRGKGHSKLHFWVVNGQQKYGMDTRHIISH